MQYTTKTNGKIKEMWIKVRLGRAFEPPLNCIVKMQSGEYIHVKMSQDDDGQTKTVTTKLEARK